MTKMIDLRGFVSGALLVLLVLCLLGAAPRLAPSNPIGRFMLVASHDSGGEVFLLDTSTGQVWGENFASGQFYAPKLTVRAPAEPNRPAAR